MQNASQYVSLRSKETSNIEPVATVRGVAFWTDLELFGWPGRYVLDAVAVNKSGARSKVNL